MRLEPNDWIVHAEHGIGRVIKLEARQFGADSEQRFYEIALAAGTLWVPVDVPSGRVRRLTAKGELSKYRSVLRGRPQALASDHRQRQNELADRFKESTFRSRCELVRDLTAYSWDKPLNHRTGALLRSAHQVVCAEWAAAEGVSLVEATREVEGLLLEGKKTSGR